MTGLGEVRTDRSFLVLFFKKERASLPALLVSGRPSIHCAPVHNRWIDELGWRSPLNDVSRVSTSESEKQVVGAPPGPKSLGGVVMVVGGAAAPDPRADTSHRRDGAGAVLVLRHRRSFPNAIGRCRSLTKQATLPQRLQHKLSGQAFRSDTPRHSRAASVR